mgnify:CR=1 FL=1
MKAARSKPRASAPLPKSLAFASEANEDGLVVALYRSVGDSLHMTAGVLVATRAPDVDAARLPCERDLHRLARAADVRLVERPYVVTESMLNPDLRGHGLGAWMYAEAVRLAWKEGRAALVGDECDGGTTSPEARLVWEGGSLRRYAHTAGLTALWNAKGGRRTVQPPKGVRMVRRPPAPGVRENPPGEPGSAAELQRAMDAAREPRYRPQEGAPVAGEWDRSSGEPRWRQSHRELVVAALRSWKGSPSELRLHLLDEELGAPLPGSGSGKIMRARAGALLWELAHNPRPATRVLYRGSHLTPEGPQSWSESRKVAELWASKNGGRVFVRAKGEPALRVLDYTTSAFDSEREWVAVGPGGAEVSRRA